MVNEEHKLNNQSEQSISDANESNNLDKTSSLTCVNGCSENTLLVGSSNTLKTSPNLNTKVSSQANKSKIKLSHQPNELLSQLYPIFPHMCLSEHHLNHLELQQTFLDSYNLGVSYCRTLYEKGGVCIFVQESLRYVSIDL